MKTTTVILILYGMFFANIVMADWSDRQDEFNRERRHQETLQAIRDSNNTHSSGMISYDNGTDKPSNITSWFDRDK